MVRDDDARHAAADPGPATADSGASSSADGELEDEAVTGPTSADDPVAQLSRERDELRGTVQRVQADFENFRKRVMREQGAQVERATEALVERLLPVLDSFELAVLNIPEGELDDVAHKLRKGVELVYAELLGVLEKAGLERMEASGKPFDPEEHEAVMREGDGSGDPHVTEVMRTGYRYRGRVLRPAMVKVTGSGGEG